VKQAPSGARGRTRTGMPCGEGFSSHFGFRRRQAQAGRSWAGARLRRGQIGCRRPPSALYTFQGLKHSPTLTGVTAMVSRRRLKFSSPLCLPISPLGRCLCGTQVSSPAPSRVQVYSQAGARSSNLVQAARRSRWREMGKDRLYSPPMMLATLIMSPCPLRRRECQAICILVKSG